MSYSKVRQTDVIIVGQGIAGCAVVHSLMDRGVDMFVINRHRPTCASYVAAGLVNPLTGRRFTLSWRYATLLEEAKSAYARWGARLGMDLFHRIALYRSVVDLRYTDDIAAKCFDPLYKDFITVSDGGYPSLCDMLPDTYQIHDVYQLSTAILMDRTRTLLVDSGRYLEADFMYDQLRYQDGRWTYEDVCARHVIFCEGRFGVANPWFADLPYRLSKGEILRIDRPGVAPSDIAMKNRAMLIPVDGHYWVGTHDSYQFVDEQPTEGGHNALMDKLSSMYRGAVRVRSHESAIRPTTKDRRPFIGSHPTLSGLHIMNGLGTKGSSMAPYLAQALVSYIFDGAVLDDEVDLQRCWKPAL